MVRSMLRTMGMVPDEHPNLTSSLAKCTQAFQVFSNKPFHVEARVRHDLQTSSILNSVYFAIRWSKVVRSTVVEVNINAQSIS